MRRFRLWIAEKVFEALLWWERRDIREQQCLMAEEEAHLIGSSGTRYIDPKTVKRGRR